MYDFIAFYGVIYGKRFIHLSSLCLLKKGKVYRCGCHRDERNVNSLSYKMIFIKLEATAIYATSSVINFLGSSCERGHFTLESIELFKQLIVA